MFIESEIMTDEEQEAYDSILTAFRKIKGLGPEGLQYNHAELTQAVHTMQMFVHQHVLNRLEPNYFSAWYDTLDEQLAALDA